MTTLDDLVPERAHRQRAALLAAIGFASNALGGPRVMHERTGYDHSSVDRTGTGAVDLDNADHVAYLVAVLRGEVARLAEQTGQNRPVFGRGRTASYRKVHATPAVDGARRRLLEHLERLDGPRWSGPCRGCGHEQLGGPILRTQCPSCSQLERRTIDGRVGRDRGRHYPLPVSLRTDGRI